MRRRRNSPRGVDRNDFAHIGDDAGEHQSTRAYRVIVSAPSARVSIRR